MILSTYNDFNNNALRDALVISICNSLTSIYAGLVVFATLGFIKHETGVDDWDEVSKIDIIKTSILCVSYILFSVYYFNIKLYQVVTDGIRLGFITYPSAVLKMDIPPIWSFLFFFMMGSLALSSQCGGLQAFIAFLYDEWPALLKHRSKVVVSLCLMYFLLGK